MSMLTGLVNKIKGTDLSGVKDSMSEIVKEGVSSASGRMTQLSEKVLSVIRDEDKERLIRDIASLDQSNLDLLNLSKDLILINPELSHSLASIVGFNRRMLQDMKACLGMNVPVESISNYKPSEQGGE